MKFLGQIISKTHLGKSALGQSKVVGIRWWSPKRGYFIMYAVCSGQDMVVGDERMVTDARQVPLKLLLT